MATSSTVPAVKAALVTRIASSLSGVSVTYGRPADNLLAGKGVWVGDVEGEHRVPVMTAGRKRREETYRVQIVVFNHLARGTQQAAELAAFTLLTEVEDVVADDPTLGTVDGLVHATIGGGFTTTVDQTAEGPVCLVTVEVDCLARLN